MVPAACGNLVAADIRRHGRLTKDAGIDQHHLAAGLAEAIPEVCVFKTLGVERAEQDNGWHLRLPSLVAL